MSTPTWASLQQEQAGQHNFEQLLQTNLDVLPDFPEFDGTLALPEAGPNGSREASKADSDVKPCFKTSNKTRDSNRRAQQVACLLSCSLHLVAWATPFLENQHFAAGSTVCASSGFSSFMAVTSATCWPLLSWMATRACSCPIASGQPRLPACTSHRSLLCYAARQPVLCCFLMQKWREKQRAKQQEMEDRLQQLTQQLQNVLAEKAFVEGRNSILQSELLRRNSPDSPMGAISSGQANGSLSGSGPQQAAVFAASRQGSGLQPDLAAGHSGSLSMAGSEELSGQVGTCIRLKSMAGLICQQHVGRLASLLPPFWQRSFSLSFRSGDMWLKSSLQPVGVQHCDPPGRSPQMWVWMHC